jgi:hypothetical protein
MKGKKKLNPRDISLDKKHLLGSSESVADFQEHQRQRQIEDEQRTKVNDIHDLINYRSDTDRDLESIFNTLQQINKKIEEILRLLKKTRKEK